MRTTRSPVVEPSVSVYDPYYEKLVGDEDNFESQEEYEYLELVNTSDDSKPSLRDGTLQDYDLEAWSRWLNHDVNANGSNVSSKPLRVLCLRARKAEEPATSQLCCSQEIWKAIQEGWALPNSVLKCLIGGGAKPFSWKKPGGTSVSTERGIVFSHKGLGVWISVVVVHNISTGATSAIINSGKNDTPDHILRNYRRCLSISSEPAFLPLLTLEHILEETETSIHDSFVRLNTVRTAIGMSPYSNNEASEDLDLLRQTVELTHLAQLYTAIGHQLDVLISNIDAVSDFHRSCSVTTRSKTEPPSPTASKDITERLEYAEQHVRIRQEWNACRIAEVQASLQTVMTYSMIGNRDNVLNFKAAEASVHIAELARKDSADMRVIAAVTLLFLPATFVATLFSTSFFNFQPENTGRHVSEWYWLYWVVTVGLTLIIGLAWVGSSRALEKQSDPLVKRVTKLVTGKNTQAMP